MRLVIHPCTSINSTITVLTVRADLYGTSERICFISYYNIFSVFGATATATATATAAATAAAATAAAATAAVTTAAILTASKSGAEFFGQVASDVYEVEEEGRVVQ